MSMDSESMGCPVSKKLDNEKLQYKLLQWFINVVPHKKITPKLLKETGLHPDMIEQALNERDCLLPPRLCPWVGGRNNVEQRDQCPGAHLDGEHRNAGGTPFLNAVEWPEELAIMGYLPEGFGKVLKGIGVPHRGVKTLLKKMPRMCRRHARERCILHETGVPPESGTIEEAPSIQELCTKNRKENEVVKAAREVLGNYVNPHPATLPSAPMGLGPRRAPALRGHHRPRGRSTPGLFSHFITTTAHSASITIVHQLHDLLMFFPTLVADTLN
ncbi:hypothetical protein CYMTET_40490 [Cymbomonas tetramitiformis]|uniref:Uncharacterized protein n=1 Tax=Cymbomonas tetramitiformis TaxID=36881 RepID=A0AAE0C7Z4_9CHLO|nr:hypothetical protein CYMTET_40490 [Cymbomonas tetramitiformis]